MAAPQYARTQTDLPYQNPFADAPQFTLEALGFASDVPEKSRLDIYVDVGYDVLHFVNASSVYRANYDVTIGIVDTLDHSIDEKMWTETIETPVYEKSVSPRESNLSVRSFTLAPGRYVVKAQITDNDTKKTFSQKRSVTVKQFQKSRFSLSDIMLVNTLTTEGEKKIISPNISGDLGSLREGVILFFEAYNRLKTDSALIFTKVYNMHHEIVRSDSFTQVFSGAKTSCFHRIATSELGAGDYIVNVEAHPHQVNADSSTIDVLAPTSRAFVVRWKGLPASVLDLDVAINQMLYILEKDRLEEMKKASPEKKKEMFVDYWRKKDPTPGTDRNELMDEYYARVEYANKHFSHFMEGWKSDMGMVYIIFGIPSNIERHPFDSDAKPYEVWTYYELNRQFIFIDQSGFGDYHLQNPIWDIWSTRPR